MFTKLCGFLFDFGFEENNSKCTVHTVLLCCLCFCFVYTPSEIKSNTVKRPLNRQIWNYKNMHAKIWNKTYDTLQCMSKKHKSKGDKPSRSTMAMLSFLRIHLQRPFKKFCHTAMPVILFNLENKPRAMKRMTAMENFILVVCFF